MSAKESKFQAALKKEIRNRFPGCKVIRLNPNDNWSGIPDLLVLCGKHWAALECKREKKAALRKHQDYYVDQMNDMSYAAFIYPGNKERVLNELSAIFKT